MSFYYWWNEAFPYGNIKQPTAMKTLSLMKCAYGTIWNALLHASDSECFTVAKPPLHICEANASFTKLKVYDNGETFHCYSRSIGSFNYVSIYEGDKQIALIETYLNTNDYKYIHKPYVLDEYNQFADTLSFFVLYYANYRFAERFHMSKGSYYEKSWSYSKYNDKYEPKWRETNFPDENFLARQTYTNNSTNY